MSDFWIFVNYRKYDRDLNMSGYNYGRVLNIPGFPVCQVSAYASVAEGSEYAWI